MTRNHLTVPKRLQICLVLIVFACAACERKVAIAEKDKLLFLRAGDLVNYGFGFQNIEKFESFSKSKNIDGTYDIEYEFKTPDEEKSNTLFIYVLVQIARKRSDALVSQKVEKLAVLYGLNRKGIHEHEIAGFGYGDSSAFYILKKDNNPVGNYFTVREGSNTYLLLITGMYFDDPQVWREVIEPKLKHFSTYART